MKKVAFYLTLIFLFTCCHKAPGTREEILARFDQNRKAFEKLDLDIRNNQQSMELFDELHLQRESSEFSDIIHQELRALGISAVAKQYVFTGKNVKPLIIFTTSWNPQYPIVILRCPQDSIQTKSGYYRKDNNNNEFMGAGNYWMVYKEIKPLRGKQ